MYAKLIISKKSDPNWFQERLFEQEVISLGRDRSNSVRLEDDTKYISRNHAELIRDMDVYRLIDPGSLNQTLLNDVQIAENIPYALRSGDIITIGDYLLKFLYVSEKQFQRDASSIDNPFREDALVLSAWFHKMQEKFHNVREDERHNLLRLAFVEVFSEEEVQEIGELFEEALHREEGDTVHGVIIPEIVSPESSGEFSPGILDDPGLEEITLDNVPTPDISREIEPSEINLHFDDAGEDDTDDMVRKVDETRDGIVKEGLRNLKDAALKDDNTSGEIGGSSDNTKDGILSNKSAGKREDNSEEMFPKRNPSGAAFFEREDTTDEKIRALDLDDTTGEAVGEKPQSLRERLLSAGDPQTEAVEDVSFVDEPTEDNMVNIDSPATPDIDLTEEPTSESIEIDPEEDLTGNNPLANDFDISIPNLEEVLLPEEPTLDNMPLLDDFEEEAEQTSDNEAMTAPSVGKFTLDDLDEAPAEKKAEPEEPATASPEMPKTRIIILDENDHRSGGNADEPDYPGAEDDAGTDRGDLDSQLFFDEDDTFEREQNTDDDSIIIDDPSSFLNNDISLTEEDLRLDANDPPLEDESLSIHPEDPSLTNEDLSFISEDLSFSSEDASFISDVQPFAEASQYPAEKAAGERPPETGGPKTASENPDSSDQEEPPVRRPAPAAPDVKAGIFTSKIPLLDEMRIDEDSPADEEDYVEIRLSEDNSNEDGLVDIELISAREDKDKPEVPAGKDPEADRKTAAPPKEKPPRRTAGKDPRHRNRQDVHVNDPYEIARNLKNGAGQSPNGLSRKVTEMIIETMLESYRTTEAFRRDFVKLSMSAQGSFGSSTAKELHDYLFDTAISEEEALSRLSKIRSKFADIPLHQEAMVEGYWASISEGREIILQNIDLRRIRQEIGAKHFHFAGLRIPRRLLPLYVRNKAYRTLEERVNNLMSENRQNFQKKVFWPPFVRAYTRLISSHLSRPGKQRTKPKD